MNILFHTNQISERGTEIALYDYAIGNQTVLNNTSFVASPKDRIFDQNILDKFKESFFVFLYQSKDELYNFIENNNINLIYKIENGKEIDSLLHENIPHFIHCVFTIQYKHGNFYCPISPFLNYWYKKSYPVLPHIVKKFPGNIETLRKTLNIPDNAIVFGGYGGMTSFNISFVQKEIINVANKYKNIYFLFMNFNSFINDNSLNNIIFVQKNTDINYKEIFINTCDAMIHAQSLGETFGLAVAEFSIKNKPVITFSYNLISNPILSIKTLLKYLLNRGFDYGTAHLDFLGKKAIRYSNKYKLRDIFINFKNKYYKNNINYDCYSEIFNETKVMKIFENIISK